MLPRSIFLGSLLLALGCQAAGRTDEDHSSNGNDGGTSSATGGAGGGATPGNGGDGGTASSPSSTGGTPSSGGASGGANGSGGMKQSPSFLLGADITITIEDEYWGATYRDGENEKALEAILQDHGFNAIRIGTFVDPKAPGGYAETQPVAFRSLEAILPLAKRVKNRGMFFLLDFHLSDGWTDPSHQTLPNAWKGLALEALEKEVHDYVFDALSTLKTENALPDMVQIGNEITNGFLWDFGKPSGSDFVGFARLLDAGISAVREIDPKILVMLHIEKCNDLATSRWWLDGVLGAGVEFDVLGQSCYAPAYIDGTLHHPGYQGNPSEWATTFSTLASEYPNLRFVIAESSAEPKAAAEVMKGVPSGRGLGTFNWDPTRYYETHPNVPLFSTDSAWNDYVTIPERIGVYDELADTWNLR